MSFETWRGYAPLYKYSKPEHIDALTRDGKFRVATLYHFKDFEASDRQRSDPGEGVRSLSQRFNEHTVFDKESQLPEMMRPAQPGEPASPGYKVHLIGDSKIIFEKGSGIMQTTRSPNFYVYCASEKWSGELMMKFGGACARITDPRRFFSLMNGRLRAYAQGVSLVRDGRVERCVYRSREVDHLEANPPHQVLMKPKDDYGHQAEVRAFWAPTLPPDQELSFIDLIDPGITKTCEQWSGGP